MTPKDNRTHILVKVLPEFAPSGQDQGERYVKNDAIYQASVLSLLFFFSHSNNASSDEDQNAEYALVRYDMTQ